MDTSTITTADFFKQLEAELKEIRVRQLDELLIHRHIFQQFAQASSPYAGSLVGGALSGWIGRNYIVFAVTAVRRMADQDPKTHSLFNFLCELQRQAFRFTRERMRQEFIGSFPSWARDEAIDAADKVFDFGVGQPGVDRLPDEVVQSDIASLKASARHVIEIANNWIAHSSKRPRVSTLRRGELDAAIDTLESIYNRYFALVTGNHQPGPSLDIYNCEEDFQKIWTPK